MPLSTKLDTVRTTLNNLFQKVESTPGGVRKGSIVRFMYRGWKHDPYPIVIVTDVNVAPVYRSDGRVIEPRIRGLNLNYLTFNSFNRVLQNCGDAGFSYRSIMGNRDLLNAFRHYKFGFGNIVNLEILDCEAIKSAAMVTRAYDPNQADAIKEAIRQQLEQRANITAEQMTEPTIEPMAEPGIEGEGIE